MEHHFELLFEYEQEELIAALRRDIRSETAKIISDSQYAGYHQANVFRSKRILETLNPKRPKREVPNGEKTHGDDSLSAIHDNRNYFAPRAVAIVR